MSFGFLANTRRSGVGLWLAAWLGIALACTGCGSADDSSPPPGSRQVASAHNSTGSANVGSTTSPRGSRDHNSGDPSRPPQSKPQGTARQDNSPPPFWDLSEQGANPQNSLPGAPPVLQPPPQIDPAKAEAAGLRVIRGQHLTLYTDLPENPEIDILPKVFDLAYPQWCEFLRLVEVTDPPWQIVGSLMKDKERFVAVGLLPEDLPHFKNGYSRGYELWLYEQPSDYYRRHLLLHEGTHAILNTRLRQRLDHWYIEGLAEYLATHLWAEGRLTTRHFPRHRDETPYLGRIKLVREAFDSRKALYFENVMALGAEPFSFESDNTTLGYAWTWAAIAFLDGHPRFRDRFRELVLNPNERNIDERLREAFAADWTELSDEWQVFIAGLDYGYDIERNVTHFRPGSDLPLGGATIEVAADKGWQSSGVRLQGGVSYRFEARGRYQIATEPKTWWCEPGGVTIRYHDSLPLGILLAALRPDQELTDRPSANPFQASELNPRDNSKGALAPRFSTFLTPAVIGLGTTIKPTFSGTLYFKINDSPAELADNAGTLQVKVMVDTQR